MSLPHDMPHLADRDAQLHQASVPSVSTPVHLAGTHLFPVAESHTPVQYGRPPPLHLHHVPSSSATSINIVAADAYSNSSSGSSTCGGASGGYVGGGLGNLPVPLPATPTRRVREFIPESKKDDEYWMKRQKNNEAAKRSREKRRANDAVMMRRIHELASENKRLKLELDVLRRQLGLLPPVTESQQMSTAAAAAPSTLDAAARLPGTEDEAKSRQKSEPPSSLMHACYSDAAPSVYRSSGVVTMMESNQRQEETNLHHRHLHHAQQALEWPTTSSVSTCVSYSTSVTDIRTVASSFPAYHRSNSGNFLPSIGDLCGRVRRQDGGMWSSYRSTPDDDRTSTCRAASLPQTPVDTAPIVIFSDVSSSDDSVDEVTVYGGRVDTLTLRPAVERVDGRAVIESPLNLSTPTRHQSPVLTGHRAAPWLSGSDLSREPTVAKRQDDGVLIANYDRRSEAPQAAEWLQKSRNGTVEDVQHGQSSRSTSLSSVASVSWQATVDVPPPADDMPPLQVHRAPAAVQLPAGSRCGLPLKVRRKFVVPSTCRATVNDNGRPPYDNYVAGVTRMWSKDHESTSSRPASSGTPCTLSPEWFSPATIERSRLDAMVDPRDGRQQ